jgi:hypothetical protein
VVDVAVVSPVPTWRRRIPRKRSTNSASFAASGPGHSSEPSASKAAGSTPQTHDDDDDDGGGGGGDDDDDDDDDAPPLSPC